MRALARKIKSRPEQERLTEAYEVRAFRDDEEDARVAETAVIDIPHAEQGAIQGIKSKIIGHGEQTVVPDDCQFGDNDLCFVES